MFSGFTRRENEIDTIDRLPSRSTRPSRRLQETTPTEDVYDPLNRSINGLHRDQTPKGTLQLADPQLLTSGPVQTELLTQRLVEKNAVQDRLFHKRPEVFYDIVIVGAGPAGLALAQCCSSIGKRVLLIEREYDVGGCHRVRRYNGFFTEHGPRIYSSTYQVFISLLRDMNLDFYKLFTPYNFTISNIGNETVWRTLTWYELFLLFIEFCKLLIDEDHGLDITMAEFMTANTFQFQSTELIDRICRLTDGADATKYTLNEFLHLFNQQYFHTIYQPKKPNDNGLFQLWKTHLYKNDVDILLGYNVDKILTDPNSDKVSNIVITQRNHVTGVISESILVSGETFVLAIPPLHLVEVLYSSDKSVQNCWGDWTLLKAWAANTAYIEYVSLTFHWNTKLKLPKIYGFPKTSWGLAYIVLTDYMDFTSSDSQTVISLAVTITDKPSLVSGKTADQSNYQELVNEIFSQLRQSFQTIPKPTRILLSPGVYHDGTRWISRDTAFITSANADPLAFQGSLSNLFTVGTHTGRHIYRFTSMESAVTNAVTLAHSLYPELRSRYPITSATTVRYVITATLVLLIAAVALISLQNA